MSAAALLLASVGSTGTRTWAETPPKAPRPAMRVPLRDLGFPGYRLGLFHAGLSMATVHALDSNHVLFTYSMRALVPRLPGDDENDTDRLVAVILVEVPSGKVLARTQWHLHDHGPYLWRLSEGVFAVRMGTDLSLITPLQALADKEEPFRRYAFPHRPGRPVLVAGSPDGRMITVEVETKLAPSAADPDDPEGHPKKHYIMEFFRITPGEPGSPPIHIIDAGAVGSPGLLRLPLDGDGYLWAEDGDRGKWNVSFNEFGGKQEKLAPVLSSCRPRLSLLSRSQFLVEECRGMDQQPMLAAYGFDGHENWEEPFGEALQPPTLALAPSAGRFAMSRLVASSAGAPVSGLGNDDPISQEIRVYQTESGDMLLRLPCAPAVRSAENFDLSPDGKTLVVLAPETLDFYRLPELTAKDRKDLAEVQSMTPPVGSGPVVLERIARPIASPPVEADRGTTTGDAGPVSAKAEAPSARQDGNPQQSATTPGGTAQSTPAEQAGALSAASAQASETVRKPPTLLKPGENPEFKGPPAAPQ